ncbi:molybdopterin-binding protein [uncultured Alsobacter sp.]|uniref:molybdopterin-binding protein n=1 Tax=uncultured Alsobacter sp. TaxID=1748258 RepID=UPI00345DCD02
MRFGAVVLEEALGGIAVHSVRLPEGAVKKGTLIGPAEVAKLRAAGLDRVVVVHFDAGDVAEDEAAGRLARAVAGEGVRVEKPATGRSNLFAETAGVLVVDGAAVDRINTVDEALTFATLAAWKAVEEGEMIGTVKIIPFAVPEALLARALEAAGPATIRVAPFHPLRVGVVSTLLPGLKPTVVRKTIGVLQGRLGPAGAKIVSDTEVPHEAGALTGALEALARSEVDLMVVFGASAITDRRDVIPAAIEAAGGRVEHFGMPVDPGNLLLVGSLGGRPVLGAPGCARSPKENGFDWVLQRLLAGLPVTRADIMRLGVGGLLMEIVQRGHPRATPQAEDD